MSSDRKEPGPIWNEPQPEGAPINAEEVSPPSPLPQRGAERRRASQPASVQRQRRVRVEIKPAPALAGERFTLLQDVLQQLSQYAFLTIVPIVFGGLTALLVLPEIASNNAFFPPESFWPTFLIIVAIMIGQGAAVYFAGSANGMWIVGTLGGFCLFLLLGSFALAGPALGLLMFILLVALAIFITRRCVHPVPEGTLDIIYTQKKYARTMYPGFNILLPWEEVTAQLHIEEVQWMCPPQVIQLSREEDVILQAVISYQLIPEDAYMAITQITNWEESLRTTFQTTLQTVTTTFTPNDFLAWPHGRTTQSDEDSFTGSFERREELNTLLFNMVRDKVALWGIQINWVSLRDIYLIPHGTAIINRPPASAPVSIPVSNETAITEPDPAIGTIPLAPVPVPESPPSATASKSEERAAPSATTEPTTPAVPIIPIQKLNEDLLVNAYRSVQEGKIKDPETIRGIAANFEAVARDTEFSQKVNFDPARAALNLYDQARKYEEQHIG